MTIIDDDDRAPEEEEVDEYLEEIVERSLAPYIALASPDLLLAMREMIVLSLTDDEVGRDLLERARRDRPVVKTGTRVRRSSDRAAGPDRKASGDE